MTFGLARLGGVRTVCPYGTLVLYVHSIRTLRPDGTLILYVQSTRALCTYIAKRSLYVHYCGISDFSTFLWPAQKNFCSCARRSCSYSPACSRSSIAHWSHRARGARQDQWAIDFSRSRSPQYRTLGHTRSTQKRGGCCCKYQRRLIHTRGTRFLLPWFYLSASPSGRSLRFCNYCKTDQ